MEGVEVVLVGEFVELGVVGVVELVPGHGGSLRLFHFFIKFCFDERLCFFEESEVLFVVCGFAVFDDNPLLHGLVYPIVRSWMSARSSRSAILSLGEFGERPDCWCGTGEDEDVFAGEEAGVIGKLLSSLTPESEPRREREGMAISFVSAMERFSSAAVRSRNVCVHRTAGAVYDSGTHPSFGKRDLAGCLAEAV